MSNGSDSSSLPSIAAGVTSELKHAEEAKRDRCWDPRERWQVLQETIAWVERQPGCRRNTPQACLQAQARRLAGGTP